MFLFAAYLLAGALTARLNRANVRERRSLVEEIHVLRKAAFDEGQSVPIELSDYVYRIGLDGENLLKNSSELPQKLLSSELMDTLVAWVIALTWPLIVRQVFWDWKLIRKLGRFRDTLKKLVFNLIARNILKKYQ